MPSEREFLEQFRVTPAGQKLLETISYAEGTRRPKAEDAYRVMFGGQLAPDTKKHPSKVISSGRYASAAAGKYQFMPETFESQARPLGFTDFGPLAQDVAALRLARAKLMPLGGLSVLEKEGFSPRVAAALAPAWASIPTLAGTSYYGQPVKSLSELQKVYNATSATPQVAQQATETAQTTATGLDVEVQPFNFEERLQNALANQATQAAFSGAPRGASLRNAQLLSQATDLEASNDPELQEQGSRLKSLALSSFSQQAGPALTPASLVSSVLQLKDQQADYYNRAARVQKTLQDLQAQQVGQKVVQNQLTGPKEGQWSAVTTGDFYKHVGTSVPSLDPGQPGIDFTIEKGRRGAMFKAPVSAEVLKVVRNPQEFRLEEGATQRGYGNYVELRLTDPKTGRKVDTLVAHFDDLNPNLKPGTKISAGTPIGTQGRTGSTTGPHISMDFFQPGSTVGLSRQEIAAFRDRIAAGLPLF